MTQLGIMVGFILTGIALLITSVSFHLTNKRISTLNRIQYDNSTKLLIRINRNSMYIRELEKRLND